MGENAPKQERRMSLAASSVSSSQNSNRASQRRMSSVSFMSPSPLLDLADDTPTPRTVNTLQWNLSASVEHLSYHIIYDYFN